MNEKLAQALDYISEAHIAEAAAVKRKRRPYWLGAVAAVLAIVILLNSSGISLALQARAVSTAEYPHYEWYYRGEEMDTARGQLGSFFAASISQSLSGGAGENQVYSPLNLYMALSLAAELSGGESREQILELMNTGSIEALRVQANQVWNASYNDDNNQALLANSLWLDKDLSYNQSVMDTLASTYYTSVYQSDLGTAGSNRAIRSWLNGQTNGFLQDEVQNAGIQSDPDTFPTFALYSTVFFRAKWSNSVEFNALNNKTDVFHAPDGDMTATYMNQKELQTTYYWGEDFGAIALGMKDGSQMWLILPDEGKSVEDVLSGSQYIRMVLNPEEYEGDGENGKYMKVNLSLPKFDIRAGGDLKADVEAMGVTDIFSADAADFSGSVNGDFPVWLTAVNQATRVAIDEKGVTAASYIEIPGAGAAMPPEEIIDFILNRPFLFIIANRYDLPLFAGVVNEP